MIDRLLKNFFGKIDDIIEWLTAPRCMFNSKKKKER